MSAPYATVAAPNVVYRVSRSVDPCALPGWDQLAAGAFADRPPQQHFEEQPLPFYRERAFRKQLLFFHHSSG
jgi:hypothetical protein